MTPVAPGTLYVVATPIGNLDDLTRRAEAVLRAVDLIVAEDTRVTAKLLNHLGIERPLRSCREQNTERVVPELIARLARGESLALVTDAGTPSVSDPGLDLVAAAHVAGHKVSPIPGASALAAAISVAGLPGDGVRFLGFLPRTGRRRQDRIAQLVHETALTVLYESPERLAATLAELAEGLGARPALVARELTKLYEEVVCLPLPQLASRFAAGTRGEIVVVISGVAPSSEEIDDATLDAKIRDALDRGRSVREVADELSRALGLPRKRVYAAALQAKGS